MRDTVLTRDSTWQAVSQLSMRSMKSEWTRGLLRGDEAKKRKPAIERGHSDERR
jgi:hypothetical protein